jgi:hypothetical protein
VTVKAPHPKKASKTTTGGGQEEEMSEYEKK